MSNHQVQSDSFPDASEPTVSGSDHSFPSEQSLSPSGNNQEVQQDPWQSIARLEADIRQCISNLPTVHELHARLERTQQALAGVPLLPLFRDLLLIRDRFVKWKDEEGAEFAESLVAELDEILARQGVERLPFVAGKFDPGQQEAVQTHSVEHAEEAGFALYLVRDGFVYNQKVLRPQQVVVGVWRDPSTSQSQGHEE